jgi:hypothetical protein
MRRLGEILLDSGALALPELHTGLEACRRTGGRLGTQLLRFGFVDERALLTALSEQYGVPAVASETVTRAPLAIRRLLPLGLMKRLQAVPFDRTSRGVNVAMINPRDPVATEEIRYHLDADFEPFVATEIAVGDALAELDDDLVQVKKTPPQATPRPSGDVEDDWDRLWRSPSVGPTALVDGGSSPGGPPPRIHLATFPGLATLDPEATGAEASLDERAFIAGLQDARDRDDVGSLLIRFVTGFLPRCALLMVHKGQMVGWMARGLALIDDVQTFAAGTDQPSVVARAASSGSPQSAILTDSEIDRRLRSALGDPPAVEVVAVPVQVKNRTVAVLVGDLPGEAVLAVPMSELEEAAARAGLAFEMLIMRQKIAS